MATVVKYIERSPSPPSPFPLTSSPLACRCHILNEMGTGLCTRLYNAKIKFSSSQMSPPCLTNSELMKVKAKVEKNFPDHGDLSRVSVPDALPSLITRLFRSKDMNYFGNKLMNLALIWHFLMTSRLTSQNLEELPKIC